ncbi:hypothetical protein P3T73_17285 [Kiritimatiellota bacterium B12222]|nr:hypothetical protein P3T73_17285 [Kiritimatiellota bacterium B12222]
MWESIQFLAPGFAVQFLLAVILLWMFVSDKDEIGLLPILSISLVYSILNVIIEWTLGDFLLLVTLVIQWSFFVLLANRFLRIPIPRASVTLFCYFTLLFGTTLVHDYLSPAPSSEEEQLLTAGFEGNDNDHAKEESDLPVWALRVESGLIAQKSVMANYQLKETLYGSRKSKRSRPVVKATPQPSLQIASSPTSIPPQGEPELSEPLAPEIAITSEEDPNEWTGARFEALFNDDIPVERITTPVPEPAKEEVDIASNILNSNEDPEVTGVLLDIPPANIEAEQLAEFVKIQNRSTDPRYPTPSFNISAVSMGDDGRYAIIDGEMMSVGSIKRTNLEAPRGWRIHQIELNEVVWQPLK